MQALPTGVYGPIPPGTVRLLLGRSSATMNGIIVQPGVIDGDYTREVKIMTCSPSKISVIQQGQRIAQLLLLPKVEAGKIMKKAARRNQGFGSSDVYWVQVIGAQRPKMKLKINGKEFVGLLDTGANVSVLSYQQWPQHWPKQSTMTQLQGIGQQQSPEQSSDLLSWEDGEGHSGVFKPYIISGLPVNLWGRDIMEKMGVYLYSPNKKVSQQMFDQGFLLFQGLGNQG